VASRGVAALLLVIRTILLPALWKDQPRERPEICRWERPYRHHREELKAAGTTTVAADPLFRCAVRCAIFAGFLHLSASAPNSLIAHAYFGCDGAVGFLGIGSKGSGGAVGCFAGSTAFAAYRCSPT
jgi:hypothetical protein